MIDEFQWKLLVAYCLPVLSGRSQSLRRLVLFSLLLSWINNNPFSLKASAMNEKRSPIASYRKKERKKEMKWKAKGTKRYTMALRLWNVVVVVVFPWNRQLSVKKGGVPAVTAPTAHDHLKHVLLSLPWQTTPTTIQSTLLSLVEEKNRNYSLMRIWYSCIQSSAAGRSLLFRCCLAVAINEETHRKLVAY